MHGELLIIALTFGAALGGGRVAARLGYPTVLGELLGGILLGPPLLGLLQPSEPVKLLGEFGVLLMMILIGMHLDLADLRKASTPGLLAAAGGFLVPAALGFGMMTLAGRGGMEALFVGLAMGVTSLATKSRILVDLRILDTRIAHVLMVGALISDLLVLVVFSAVVGEGSTDGVAAMVVAGLGAIAFLLGSLLIGTKVIPAVARRLPNRPDGPTAFLVILITGLGFGWMAELAGLHAILGAFVGGLFLSDRMIGPRTAREVRRRLTTVSVGSLAPLFFVSAGFEVTFDVFRTDLALLVAVVVLATVGKVVGTAVFYAGSRNGWREGVVLGAGMNGRGAVEIIVAELALAAGLIDQTVFSILVFMAIITTATVPVLLTRGVAWLRDRGELVRAGDRTAVIVVGAQPLARVIARLLHTSGPVTLIDSNQSHVDTARDEGLAVHKGNALDDLVLQEAGIDRAKSLVAATANPEVNLLAAQTAREMGVGEVVIAVSELDRERFRTRIAEIEADVLVVPDGPEAWDEAIQRGQIEERSSTVAVEAASSNGGRPELVEFPIAVGRGSDRRLACAGAGSRPDDPLIVLARPRMVEPELEGRLA